MSEPETNPVSAVTISRLGNERSSENAERLASLHSACLPESLLASLGHKALVRYYEYVTTAPNELVLVARIDGILVGACVMSYAPATLLRRFAFRAPFALFGAIVGRLVVSSRLRRRCLARLYERDRSGELEVPEIVQIFTDRPYRGRRIGSQLLRSCETTLRDMNARAYTAKTLRDGNDAGIRFYRREGFVTMRETRSFGDHFFVMEKELR